MTAEKRTQVYLTESQHRSAMEVARRRGTSLAAIVREALDRYLVVEEDGARTTWEADPALDLIGTLELQPLDHDEELSEAIDRSVYD